MSGLKYLQVVKRAGVAVDKTEAMLGSYGPQPEDYTKIVGHFFRATGMRTALSCDSDQVTIYRPPAMVLTAAKRSEDYELELTHLSLHLKSHLAVCSPVQALMPSNPD